MEIIHLVLGKANPDRMNGVNKVVFQLASRQSESGGNVSVWGITSDTTVNFGERNFKTRLFLRQVNPFRIPPSLKSALLEKKVETVVHIHGGWIPVFSSISKLLHKNSIPFIFTPHGAYNIIAMKRNGLVKKIYFHLAEKCLIQNAAKIHCIGHSELVGLSTIHKTDKTILLPYGYEASNQSTELVETSNKVIIGFVGRIDIYTKGLDLLIEAFAGFKQTVPKAELWIVGDSSEIAGLKHLIQERGLSDSVLLHGSKFNQEKNALLQKMDVFVHPSRNEGLPAAVLEAADFGIPCIVSEATNLAQYIINYQAGIAVANENVNELIEAFHTIHQLKLHNSLTTMKRGAKEMVEKAFGWEKLIVDFYKMYYALLPVSH